jgi:hypothetical protein
VRVRAAPIGPGIAVIEHVELGRGLLAQHGEEGRGLPLVRLDHLRVGHEHPTLVRRDPLGSEEQLGRAEHEGVLATLKGVAQDQMDELVEEQGRQAAGAAPGEVEIGGLQRRRGKEPVAEGEKQPPSSRARPRRRGRRPPRIGRGGAGRARSAA